jgi:hypothetical protein
MTGNDAKRIVCDAYRPLRAARQGSFRLGARFRLGLDALEKFSKNMVNINLLGTDPHSPVVWPFPVGGPA